MAAAEKNVSFVGRLATYRHYNMDQVVGMALAGFDRLRRNKDMRMISGNRLVARCFLSYRLETW
jgi:UDP-galactopyranose mutase